MPPRFRPRGGKRDACEGRGGCSRGVADPTRSRSSCFSVPKLTFTAWVSAVVHPFGVMPGTVSLVHRAVAVVRMHAVHAPGPVAVTVHPVPELARDFVQHLLLRRIQ